MKTFLNLLPWFLVFVMILVFIKGYNLFTPQYERAMQPANTQAIKELSFKSFEWTYIDTDKSRNKFAVNIYIKKIVMIGIEGSLEGTKIIAKPQFTKVGEMLYFLTWTTKIGQQQSIVLDCKNNRIHTHINSNGRFWGMSGKITCNAFTDDCKKIFLEAKKKYN